MKIEITPDMYVKARLSSKAQFAFIYRHLGEKEELHELFEELRERGLKETKSKYESEGTLVETEVVIPEVKKVYVVKDRVKTSKTIQIELSEEMEKKVQELRDLDISKAERSRRMYSLGFEVKQIHNLLGGDYTGIYDAVNGYKKKLEKK